MEGHWDGFDHPDYPLTMPVVSQRENIEHVEIPQLADTVTNPSTDRARALCRSNAGDTARSRLRSAAHGDLQVPRSKTNFSDG